MKKILKNKAFVWFLIALPLLIEIFFVHDLTIKQKAFWKHLLIFSGFTALFFLIFVLLLHPLIALFPKIQLFKLVNRHRRLWGLACFYYACIHLSAYLIKKMIINGKIELKYFFHPVIFLGLFAFLLLFILALTSNNICIRNLGYHSWKKVHFSVYFVEILVFFHMALQKGWALFWALLFFPLLFVLQMKRIR